MRPNDAGIMKPRITANVTVVDGQGPVPVYKNRVPTGQFLDGPDFPGMYISQERVVTQLQSALKARGRVLVRVGLHKPEAPAGQGNPWGLTGPSEQDAQIARQFLATRTVDNAIPVAAPVPQAPVYAQSAPVYAPQPAAPTPQSYPVPAAPPALPQPGSAPAGVNPFAR
jgi:hypothetical protein